MTAQQSLTQRQQAILDFIRKRIEQTQAPPTRAEICTAFNFASTRAAQKHLLALSSKGALELDAGNARGMRLLDKRDRKVPTLSLAILGRVAAGQPIEAGIAESDPVSVDQSLFHPQPDYLLRVVGDSMKDEGIFHHDLVAIKQSPTAEHNRIVVARLNDAVTIKKLVIQENQIWLMPRNPEFAPLRIEPDMDFAIEGLFCGLLRKA